MKILTSLRRRLAALVFRRRLDRDLDDELAFHLAMREAEYAQQGLPPQTARSAARRRFGNLTLYREEARDVWMFRWLEHLRQDSRFSFRALRRAPGFTTVAVLVLAIGIGATTAMFTLVDALRVQALPFENPASLVELWGNVMRQRVERRGASYPDLGDWRARADSFEDIAAFDGQMLTLSGVEEPERIQTEFVSASYFRLLRVQPARGRTFSEKEDLVASPQRVIVLGDGLWKRRFGADPSILGTKVTLNANPYTVIGIMPPGFKGLTDAAELWVPFALYAPPRTMENRGNRGFAALARLKPDVPIAAAQAEMDAIARQLQQEHPATNERRGVEVSPLDEELFGDLRPALTALMAAVGFVLLIACTNVANLLLARSEARRREMAVRSALGAGRGRLLRQMVTEGCVLTLLGAVAGVFLARALVAVLVSESPITLPSFVTPGLDVRAAAFTVAVSMACGILVGLAPWFQARSVDPGGALKEAARNTGNRHAQRVRSTLVVAELAMAVVLLVGAGLMIRSVSNLAALDPGFDPDSVLTLHVSVPRVSAGQTPPDRGPASQPAPPSRPAVHSRDLLERLRIVPGVSAVALGSDLPLDGTASARFYVAEGMSVTTAETRPRAYVHRVSPGFFSTLRIPLVAGRTFTEHDVHETSPAVIVSEGVVQRFWRGQDPIGRRIKFGALESDSPWLSVIGVVREVRYRGLPENPTSDPDLYLPLADQHAQIAVAVRASIPPASVAAELREAVRSLHRGIPVYAVAPMEQLIADQTARSRFTMWLMGAFAGIALLLAVVGIYGVMAYVVSQRTREIGIRLALGAARMHVLGLIAGSGMRLVATGVAVGILLASAVGRLMSSLVFGTSAADVSSVLAVALLVATALAACLVAAARAMRVDPNEALRYE